MTMPAARRNGSPYRPASAMTSAAKSLRRHGPAQPLPLPTRSYEVAALRTDGSLLISSGKIPAVPLFESAFSAFARGTLIATPQGEVAVEDLQPGDRISTEEGKAAKVVWIGSSSFVPADAGRRMPLVRIMPDSFGQGRPGSFLTVGPAARLLHTPHHLRAAFGERRMLTPVHEFIDGVNVIKVVPPTPIRLFHICLDRHALIRAGGMAMESFYPDLDAMEGLSRGLCDRFIGLFPHISRLEDFGAPVQARAPDAPHPAEVI